MLGLAFDGDTGTGAKFQLTTGYYCDVENPLNMMYVPDVVLVLVHGCADAGFFCLFFFGLLLLLHLLLFALVLL